jgi:hypothetical protein
MRRVTGLILIAGYVGQTNSYLHQFAVSLYDTQYDQTFK